jgi:phospholipid transport system substrate-binding protein
MRHTAFLAAAVLAAAAAGWRSADAAAAPGTRPGPIQFLKANDARAKTLLASAPADAMPASLRDTLKAEINRAFDFGTLSRLALGNHWAERTPAERDHFVATFSAIIQEQNFDSFVRYYREGQINYRSETANGDTARVVATVPLKREQIEIEYALHTSGDTWRIWDLVVDGVSTAEGNQRRYARYLEKNPYQQLIGQLDKQLERLRAGTP